METGGAFPGGTNGPITGAEGSMMPLFLRGLRAALYFGGWEPGSDMNLGFPDVWSAVQFAACCPREVWSGGQPVAEQLSAPAEFGDALPWCGWGDTPQYKSATSSVASCKREQLSFLESIATPTCGEHNPLNPKP